MGQVGDQLLSRRTAAMAIPVEYWMYRYKVSMMLIMNMKPVLQLQSDASHHVRWVLNICTRPVNTCGPLSALQCSNMPRTGIQLPHDAQVDLCPRTDAHDWEQCPFSHPGDKSRRYVRCTV